MLLGIAPNVYIIQGIAIINPNTSGNITVQQTDISWSKRILGKDALIHINANTITKVFIDIFKLDINASNLKLGM